MKFKDVLIVLPYMKIGSTYSTLITYVNSRILYRPNIQYRLYKVLKKMSCMLSFITKTGGLRVLYDGPLMNVTVHL